MKRLALLHTGGTIVMRRAADGSLEPAATTDALVGELPVLARLAELEVSVVANLDSGDMQPGDWIVIARAVHAALSRDDVDGVVVLHGTDTMAYTASAVALVLGPVPKPVVFTGAQRPLFEARTDARSNLVDACWLAAGDVCEVGIAFASRMFRAVRTTKRDAWALDAFDSPRHPPLVDLGVGVAKSPLARPGGALAPLDPRVDPRVLAVRVFPGLEPVALVRALASGTRGLVLEAYGSGNLPHLSGSLIPVLHDARDRGIPVLVVTQCHAGAVELSRYRGGAEAARAGAISGRDMTIECAIAKTMVALGRYDRLDAVRGYLGTDQVGEMSMG